jgi:hypothetical protein
LGLLGAETFTWRPLAELLGEAFAVAFRENAQLLVEVVNLSEQRGMLDLQHHPPLGDVATGFNEF